jgi:hypothetical protein
MKRKTQELLEKSVLLNQPDYSEDELKDIAEKLAATKDEKAGRVYALLLSIGFDPFIFQDWCEAANEEYDYNGLFYTSLDNMPLVIADMTELDSIEDVVVRWRLDHNK